MHRSTSHKRHLENLSIDLVKADLQVHQHGAQSRRPAKQRLYRNPSGHANLYMLKDPRVPSHRAQKERKSITGEKCLLLDLERLRVGLDTDCHLAGLLEAEACETTLLLHLGRCRSGPAGVVETASASARRRVLLSRSCLIVSD
jgi:hypothetical protein